MNEKDLKNQNIHKKHHHHHHHKKHTGLKIFGVIILLFVLSGGIYAAKIYHDVDTTAKQVYKSKGSVANKRPATKKNNLSKATPFSILLLGVDTGELGRTEQGRSDTMMVVTVNEQKKQTHILSLARDTRVPIVGNGTTEKINAAYAHGGVPMAINTVQSYLDIPIDYYVEMNMKGLEQLVDAVGGVTVDNTLDFSQGGYHFQKGSVKLDGKKALEFVRMRHEDPEGDYGRQLRQQQIVQAIVKKSKNLKTVSNYKQILQIMQANIKTNLTVRDMLKIQQNYPEANHIFSDQLKGTGKMIDGVSYELVAKRSLIQAQNQLHQQLNLK